MSVINPFLGGSVVQSVVGTSNVGPVGRISLVKSRCKISGIALSHVLSLLGAFWKAGLENADLGSE